MLERASAKTSWVAMTSNRPYRAALGHHVACEELRAMAGTQFDPAVVEAFLAETEERYETSGSAFGAGDGLRRFEPARAAAAPGT